MIKPAPLLRSACCCLVLAGTSITLAAQQSPYAGEWPLDGVVPGVAVDLAGANDGVLNNFAANPWVTGVHANALAFDGVDDWVMTAQQTAPIFDGLGSPYSVSFWVKGPQQSNKFIYAEGATTSNNPIILFGSGLFAVDQDKFRVLVRNQQGVVALEGISDAPVFDNTWHHVVFVDNSGQCACYIDGVPDTGSFTYDPARAPGMPGFGSYPLNTATMGALRRGALCCFLTAEVDDLRLYRFAMTSNDVLLAGLGVQLLPPSASIGHYGLGCGTGPLQIVGSGSAQIGGSGVDVRLQSGQPGSLGIYGLDLGDIVPTDLSVLGFAGCTLYPANPLTLFAGVFDAAGMVPTLNIPVPANTALLMMQLNSQGAALVGSSLEFSNVVLATLGN